MRPAPSPRNAGKKSFYGTHALVKFPSVCSDFKLHSQDKRNERPKVHEVTRSLIPVLHNDSVSFRIPIYSSDFRDFWVVHDSIFELSHGLLRLLVCVRVVNVSCSQIFQS